MKETTIWIIRIYLMPKTCPHQVAGFCQFKIFKGHKNPAWTLNNRIKVRYFNTGNESNPALIPSSSFFGQAKIRILMYPQD